MDGPGTTPEELALRDLHAEVVAGGGRRRSRSEDLLLSLTGSTRLDGAARKDLQALLAGAGIRCDPPPTDPRFTADAPVTLWASRERADHHDDIGDEIHGLVTSVREERQERLAREKTRADELERVESARRRRDRRASTLTAAGLLSVAAVLGGGVGYVIGHGSTPDAPAAAAPRTVTAQADDSARMRELASSSARQRDWDSAILFAEQAGDRSDVVRYRRNAAQVLEAQAASALTAGDPSRAKSLATQARRQYGTAASRAPKLIAQADAALAGQAPQTPATPTPQPTTP